MELQEFVELATSVIDRLVDRIDPDSGTFVRVAREGGEWGESVDNLVAALVQEQIPVSVADRDDLTRLSARLPETAARLGGLNVRTGQ